MNVHPIFVHFPVALLSIYALLEIVRFRKFTSQDYWFYLKVYMLFIGTAFSYAALYTGGLAEDLKHQASMNTPADSRAALFHLIDVHSNWAVVTAIVFSLISVLYIIEWVRRSQVLPQKFADSAAWQTALKVNKFLLSAPIIIPLAILGLLAITVTGALGGAVEYGQHSDPIVQLIYNITIK